MIRAVTFDLRDAVIHAIRTPEARRLFERKCAVIRAITFDLRDTVIHDDSHEPMRAAAGPPPKSGNAP